MIEISIPALIAILGICVPVVGACVRFIYKAGNKVGEMSGTLDALAKAVDKLSNLGERVVALETKLNERD